MRIRIFALAFTVGFVFCFSAAAIFVFRFGGENRAEEEVPKDENVIFLEENSAVFLLAFEEKGSYGPFCLVNFDAKTGRIPVFTFSKKAALSYGGVSLAAGELFAAVSPEVFAGTVEMNLGIELDGYFIIDEEAAENIIAKAGSFDYVLPQSLYYSGGESYINLAVGVQNITGKKLWDIVTYPNFSEKERCDTASRLGAAFFNRRLRRFLPESSLYSTVFNYAETDVSAYDKERYAKIIEALCLSGESLAGHITNDTEKDLNTGLLYFSDETKERIKKYFG